MLFTGHRRRHDHRPDRVRFFFARTPTPSSATPASGRSSTRTRRRTATATDLAPPLVDDSFRSGWDPRQSSRLANTRSRVPRPRPTLSITAIPAPTGSRVPTLSIASDGDRAGCVKTPRLRLLSTPGDTPTVSTKLDTLGQVNELQFEDSARFSHADWEREQQAELTCLAAMRYISISRPQALPPDIVTWYLSHKRPSFSDEQELNPNGRLHKPDDDIVFPTGNPPPLLPLDVPCSVGRAACLLNDDSIRK